ncbi:transcription regulator LysR family protein [Streptomyces spiroverticillatus]|uniref:Transcription regulator LysR family protein n=1 Tax=Streptomyces finlayi TaxID=67296 RepID=A0A918WUK5_9ACTN|nr:transcriptional regulator CynR [Streptomyces finlayi]GHA00156.1 transcription regulator LysR family protein [Streptomyces spiroverticillatus]GHC84660.1 transcription regulator LysR family protein [Streptomyces finlayi]
MPALELRHLRYLLAVAEHANFTRAAEELHISQPTLSQQIKQLERALKVQLLDRSGRSVRLTDAGEAYVTYARRALTDLAAGERAVLDVGDLSRGTLRVAMTPTFTTYLMGPLVADFHARHPGISLDVREMTQARMETELLDDRIDVGIAFLGEHATGVTARPLFEEGLALVVGSSAHPYAKNTRALPLEELAAAHLALLSEDFATRRHLDAYFERYGVRPAVAVEANSLNVLVEVVGRGALATVLPDPLAAADARLHRVPVEPPLPSRTAALLLREAAYRSAAVRAFEERVAGWVREKGYGEA